MNTPTRVVGFLAVIAAVFGIALGVGNAVGPFSEPDSTAHDAGGGDSDPGDSGEGPRPALASQIPGGLMVSQNGYSLSLVGPQATVGRSVPVAFTINGPDGRPVTAYDVEHEKRLHLIAVRRDFTGFQHVHPTLDTEGVWSTDLDLLPGQWRLFADFKATGADALTLGADLVVAGDYQPAVNGAESRTANVDGYTVALDGDLAPGADAKLTLSVSKDGEPVTDLEPYLGAYGHLVALREGDLAYLHVHPDGSPGDGTTQPGPAVVFYAAVPSAGSYQLYFDFEHDGMVRTADFTVNTTGSVATETPAPSDNRSEDGHSGH